MEQGLNLMQQLRQGEARNLQQELGELGQKLFVQLLELTSYGEDYEYTLERCRAQKLSFVDHNFPPNHSSLEEPLGKAIVPAKEYTWKRCGDIFDRTSMRLFPANGIDLNNFHKGMLSDLRFLSAVVILAERPALLESLFVSKDPSEWGLYGIRLYLAGEEKIILIDDYLPCDPARPESPTLALATTAANELWLPLLEKAWAKLHGSFHIVDDGMQEMAAILRDLTGAQCVMLNHDDDQLWSSLMEAKEKGWMMAASASNTAASKDLLAEMGLDGNFAYAILDVCEIETRDTTEQIMQLRNVWGAGEWIGDWSESSNMWTEELRARMNWDVEKGQRERKFWMSFADFCHYFSRVQICRVGKDCRYSYARLQPSRSHFCYRLKVARPTYGCITISQPDKKHFGHHDDDYALVRLIIAKVKADPVTSSSVMYIKGTMKIDREVSEEHLFEDGDHLLYIEVDHMLDRKEDLKTSSARPLSLGLHARTFTLSVYAESSIQLLGDEAESHPKFLEEVYSSCAVLNNEPFRYEAEGAPQCAKYSDMRSEGYGYTYLQNDSEDASIKECVTYTMFDGLELVPPFHGTSYEVLVPPRSSRIVLLRQKSTAGYNLSYSYTSNIILTTEAIKKRIKVYGVPSIRKNPYANGDIEIKVYTLKHGGGICYLYENNTAELILEEHVTFKTSGLEIVGERDNVITVKIGPGESKFIELKAVTVNWNIQTSVTYSISPVRKPSDEEPHS